ncbi:MAG: glycosyltransferase family 2 protein [Balneola sp.]
MKGFSVIIVTWNGLDHLKTFLPSVCATDYPNFEIILADNASTDGTFEWTREHYPKVKISTFDDNYGYCGGNNRAVAVASKEILLFLNNDVEVKPNWLHAINHCFSENSDVGAVQPKLLSYKDPECFEYAGAAGGYIDKYGYPFCRGRIFDTVEKDDGQYDDITEIFWASGAALAIRKDIFIELDGFDEDFEFHMEEIDLCWRTKRLGYKVMYTPSSEVYHLGGGSLAMGSPRKVYYNFRNNLFMLWKNYSTSELLFKFPVRFILDIIAAWRSLLSGNSTEFGAIAKAHFHFFFQWVKVHKKRSQNSSPKPKELTGKKSISIIWKYFIQGKKVFNKLD